MDQCRVVDRYLAVALLHQQSQFRAAKNDTFRAAVLQLTDDPQQLRFGFLPADAQTQFVINDVIDGQLNEYTLMRLWGYLRQYKTIRHSTLDLLAGLHANVEDSLVLLLKLLYLLFHLRHVVYDALQGLSLSLHQFHCGIKAFPLLLNLLHPHLRNFWILLRGT